MGKKKQGANRDLQERLAGDEMLEKFFRHLGGLQIDLDEEELEIESTFPDDSYPFGVGNYELSRTLDLEDHPKVRDAVKKLVAACHEAMLKRESTYDADRCDRCVKADCCTIDRIHLTEAERVRILAYIEVEDTPANSKRYFEKDDDLAGYYRHIMRHKDGGCSFLKEQGGIMRCSIYEARPKVCREYDSGYCTEYTKLLPRRAPLKV